MNHFTNLQSLTFGINHRKIFINFGSKIPPKFNFYTYYFDDFFHIECSSNLNNELTFLEPTICVVYFNFCGEDEIKFLSYLQKIETMLKVIVISESADVDFVIKSFKCGIMDFICKDLTLSLLGPALIDADRELSVSVGAESVRKNASDKLDLLTRREREVLDCLSSGLQNKTIASNLNLSIRTIEMFRSSIIEKLKVKNATEAVKVLLTSEKK